MTFDEWFDVYAPTAPEILDECAKAAWDAAFRDGYEKGVAAFHEAVKAEREACAAACEGQTEGFAATSTWDEAALACARTIRMRSNNQVVWPAEGRSNTNALLEG